MFNRLVLGSLIISAAVGLVYASQSDSKTIVIGNQPASNGKQMYMSYCASCHGVDGRGSGPLASSLQIPPADLTQLSKNNHGKYPSTRVISVLQSGASTPGHGTAAMPVWGSVFARMDGGERSLTKALRMSNLSGYLETIQAR
jgi:mono/diheme cytochrome c family protein